MIDIHSHFLYGIDDGSKNRSQTISMLYQAEEAGITDVVATPHVNETTNLKYLAEVNDVFNEIKKIVSKESLKLKIHKAAEIVFDVKTIQWIDKPDLCIGKKQKYILFELPLYFEFTKVSQIIFELSLKYIKPILAHPERSMKIQESPEMLIKWLNQGCLMQMNAGSILGQFGKKCQSISRRFIESGVIHLFASDAHDSKYRNYITLKTAYEMISTEFDSTYANLLFAENPNKILYGGKVNFFNVDEDKLMQNPIKRFFNKLYFITGKSS